MKPCAYCGRENEDDATGCRECGTTEFGVAKPPSPPVAFLVCYSRSAPADHTRQDAILLDQKFYELIFRKCMMKRSYYANLSVIASLRYKSPYLVVADQNLDSLASELADLVRSGQTHPQLAEFRLVCAKAKADGCSLSISGGMYPEL